MSSQSARGGRCHRAPFTNEETEALSSSVAEKRQSLEWDWVWSAQRTALPSDMLGGPQRHLGNGHTLLSVPDSSGDKGP